MSPPDRRRFLRMGAVSACACVLSPNAFARAASSNLYICPPCGCVMDGKEFTAPGTCPACHMTLIPKPEPASVSDATLLPVEVIRSDFKYLYEALKASHYDLFARRLRPAYDACFEQMQGQFTGPQTHLQVQMAFQTFVAFGKVAHAHMEFPQAAFDAFRDAGGRFLPLGVRILKGRIYITQNFSGLNEITPGSELLAIDGQSASELLSRLGPYVSADTDYLAHALIEKRFNALMWLIKGERDAFRLDLLSDKIRHQIVMPARTRPEAREIARHLPPTFSVDSYSREAKLMADIAYLRPGPFMNIEGGLAWDTTSFEAFIDGAFQHFLYARARALIIDLRGNPGGDALFSNLMIRWFASRPFRFYSTFRLKASVHSRQNLTAQLATYAPYPDSPTYRLLQALHSGMAAHRDGETFPFEVPPAAPRSGARFEGKVLVLTDRHTFSNATAVAALIQDHGFGQIAGEATADLPSSFGASESFALPGSGLSVTYPKSWFVRPNGHAALCGVTPDHPIATPLADGHEDEVLTAAIGLV